MLPEESTVKDKEDHDGSINLSLRDKKDVEKFILRRTSILERQWQKVDRYDKDVEDVEHQDLRELKELRCDDLRKAGTEINVKM